MKSVLRCARTALPAVVVAGLLFATPAVASSSTNAAQRALARCQQTVAREGLSYSGQMQWRISRCVRALNDCATLGIPAASCRGGTENCRSMPADMAWLQDRLTHSIAMSCNGVPMPSLMSAGFAPGMAACAPASLDAFEGCIAANLRRELGDVLEQILPSSCLLLASAAVPVPAELCMGLPQCQPPPTVTTTTETTITTVTSTSTSTTTTTMPVSGDGPLYCGGPTAVTCPTGAVCNRVDALCTQSTPAGMCVTVADVCPQGTPVCGCDGITYASDCERLKAGVVKTRDGACDAPPSACTIGGPACPDGQFCEFPPGDCGEGGNGMCRPMRAEPCNLCTPFVAGPVCGCDFVTYATECERMAVGASKMWLGACQ